jgi:hypothetical protein
LNLPICAYFAGGGGGMGGGNSGGGGGAGYGNQVGQKYMTPKFRRFN